LLEADISRRHQYELDEREPSHQWHLEPQDRRECTRADHRLSIELLQLTATAPAIAAEELFLLNQSQPVAGNGGAKLKQSAGPRHESEVHHLAGSDHEDRLHTGPSQH